tara:strand:- start:369 stop:542 length:174 start_codon:yes stop_codon:yes gene_type:complete
MLKTYRVFAKREEYYSVEVEASSLEEAEEQVDEGDNIDWEPLLDGGNFEIFNTEEVE